MAPPGFLLQWPNPCPSMMRPQCAFHEELTGTLPKVDALPLTAVYVRNVI
jgi:hypothetical protein